MNTEPIDSPGYHFAVTFMPEWAEVLPIVAARARRLGYAVSEDGNEIAPLASSLTFSGTRWLPFARGGLRFDVLEHRRDLRANVVKAAGALADHPTYSFGLAHPERLGNAQDESRNEVAVGVWLNQGSLSLLATDHPTLLRVHEQTLARFDVWEALESMRRLARGEPTNLQVVKEADLAREYAAPEWAPDLITLRVRSMADRTAAILRHPSMRIGIGVNLIVRGPSDLAAGLRPST